MKKTPCLIPKLLEACGGRVAAAILVAFGGLAPATRAVADVPPGTAGRGTGRFPDPPRMAGPVYKPALAGDELIRKLGSNKLVFIERYTFQSNHFYTDIAGIRTSVPPRRSNRRSAPSIPGRNGGHRRTCWKKNES